MRNSETRTNTPRPEPTAQTTSIEPTTQTTSNGYRNLDIFTYTSNCGARVFTAFFNILCFLTGQYIFPGSRGAKFWLSTIIIFILLILNIGLNLSSVVFDICAVAFCWYSEDCGFIYTLPYLRNISGASHHIKLQPPTYAEYDDWQKVVITTATISGALSFFFMAYVLHGRYGFFAKYVDHRTGCCCCLKRKIAKDEPRHHKDYIASTNRNVFIIHPFKNDQYSVRDIMNINIPENPSEKPAKDDSPFLSSLITVKESCYFHFFFISNISVFFVAIGLIAVILHRRLSSFNSILEGTDLLGLIAQFASQFSAILSCFIFSKVAYAVTNHCFDFGHCIFQHVAERSNERNCLSKLKKTDQKYCMLLRNSLKPYGAWFAVHWLLYTVTSFMGIAYVADQIIMELYGTEPGDKKCHGYHDFDCQLGISYSIFFALEHCILFIYPCFRAASVTRARSNMIKYVSNLDLPNITSQEKEAFLSYLRDQKASFKISILCAELPFGFSLAILSLFIGILGVVMKLSV